MLSGVGCVTYTSIWIFWQAAEKKDFTAILPEWNNKF
jgi:hypothetical protein